jgi:hypothetical protein
LVLGCHLRPIRFFIALNWLDPHEAIGRQEALAVLLLGNFEVPKKLFGEFGYAIKMLMGLITIIFDNFLMLTFDLMLSDSFQFFKFVTRNNVIL